MPKPAKKPPPRGALSLVLGLLLLPPLAVLLLSIYLGSWGALLLFFLIWAGAIWGRAGYWLLTGR